MSDAYSESGVSIDAGNESVRRIKGKVASTHNSFVLTGIGSFGSLYDIKAALAPYTNPVLVQSIDGVGTKLTVARMMNKYDGVGADIVNHSCNDILAMGAKPLTFLDYVAHEKLDPAVMEAMVGSMSDACRENGIALIGGETAEMPGVYMQGEHDIAGVITGVVEREKIITGEKVQPDDAVLGFGGSGLHTNGFSLARNIFFKKAGLTVNDKLPELSGTIGEELLKVHVNYVRPVLALLEAGVDVRAIAHITGGGFIDNIPRALPENCNVEIARGSWPILPIFSVMQKLGGIDEMEMYRVFNMGIGLTIIVPQTEKARVFEMVKNFPEFSLYEIGTVVEGNGEVTFK